MLPKIAIFWWFSDVRFFLLLHGSKFVNSNRFLCRQNKKKQKYENGISASETWSCFWKISFVPDFIFIPSDAVTDYTFLKKSFTSAHLDIILLLYLWKVKILIFSITTFLFFTFLSITFCQIFRLLWSLLNCTIFATR